MKNNKGTTILETVITLSILMVITLLMMTIIISLKNNNKKSEELKEITEYQNIISRKINDDLIMLKLKEVTPCNKEYEDYIYCKILVFEEKQKELIIDTGMSSIKYEGIKYKTPAKTKIKNIKITEENNIFSLNINLIKEQKDFNIKIIYPM